MSMQSKAKRAQRSHGAAMLLVLIAVAMCTIMALSFLAAQQPTAAVAANIDRKTQARAIAESALKMAIDYVNEDADWRSDKTSGTWMADIALDGGTFTLTGTDEDDGDLSDDSSDTVLLTVVASYAGVTHRVSALVTPGVVGSSGNRLLLVAGNGNSPSSTDQAKRDLFESWGYVVTIIDDSDSSSIYNDAVAVNDVAYVSEEVSSSSVNTKLRDATIGVVNEESYLHDDFGFSSTNSGSGVSSDSIDIVNTSHPITSGFTVGSLTFYSSSINVRHITGSMPSGMTILADASGSGTQPNLVAADIGDTLSYGPAAGRRVIFFSTDNLDVDDLNSDGQTLLQRSIEWAAGGSAEPEGEVPTLLALYEFNQVEVAPTLAGRWKLDETGAGYAGAVQVIDNVTITNGGYIDAYDASAGAYGGSNQQLSVRMFTDTTTSGDISLNNATIYGDVIVGAGGDPNSVISLSNGATVTGNTSAQSSSGTIPSYDAPSGFPASLGNTTLSSVTNVWSSDTHYDDLTINSGSTITVSGDVRVRVSGDFDLDDSDIILDPGASLVLWVGRKFDMSGEATINNDTTRPGDLEIILYGDSINYDFTVNNSTIVGSVHSADDIVLTSGAKIFGSVTNEDDLTINNSELHLEIATSPPDSEGTAPPTIAADASSLANDGTINGSPLAGVAGQHGTAFDFDGSSDYIEIPHDDSYLMQGGTFSVWFKADTVSGRLGIFSKDSTDFDTGGHFSVWILNGKIEVRMQDTVASYFVQSANSSIATGTWYHVMFAWGEEGMALYLDGALVDTNSYTGGIGTTSGGIGNYEPVVLGANAMSTGDLNSTGLKGFFDGVLDDFRIYNERLSESQALEIYNGAIEPSPFLSKAIIEDTSGYEEALTLAVEDTDAVSWASGSMAFTGNTQATSLSPAVKLHDAIAATGEFSVEVLLVRASPGTTASPSRIVELSEGSSDANFVLGQDNTDYEARVRDSSTGISGTLSPEFISSTGLSASGDTHVVLSYKDGEVSVYLDGQLDETRTLGGMLSNWEDDLYLMMGGAFGGGHHWQGTLKRVAIYDRGFDAGQANNVYNGSDPGLPGSGGAPGGGSVQWDELD